MVLGIRSLLPRPAAVPADIKTVARIAIRRNVGLAGSTVDHIRIAGVERQRADVWTRPARPAASPSRAAIGGNPDTAGRRAGPQTSRIGRMRQQRRDPASHIVGTGALPTGQLRIPRGLRAPAPVILHWRPVAARSPLREPGAVALVGREFVVHHFMPNLSKYQSSLRTRRASISRRRSEMSPSTSSAIASPKPSCLSSARTVLASRGAER